MKDAREKWPAGAAVAWDYDRELYVELCEPAGFDERGNGYIWYRDLRCSSYNMCGEHWFLPETAIARELLRVARGE